MDKPINVVAHLIDGNQNGTWMWPSGDDRRLKCQECGYCVDFFAFNEEYVTGKTYNPLYMRGGRVKSSTSFAYTLDGANIVTTAYREFCEREKYDNLRFESFSRDPDHFYFVPNTQVKFDYLRRGTVFDNLCDKCGNYEAVVGATPSMLLVSAPLPDGIFRSDILFGTGDSKGPMIFVGIETKIKMKAAGLTGIWYEPAYGLE